MERRHPHPSAGPVLPLIMILSFLATFGFLRSNADRAVPAACFAFALFLVSFALYTYTWLHREHTLWRESGPD